MKNFKREIIQDIRVELLDEFDRNFTRKAFFDKSWPKSKSPNSRGSMMQRTGALRKGMRGTIEGNRIRFSNSQPYASIHNEGGTITVTPQMIKFFWAMYYKTSNGSGGSKGKKQRSLNEEAEMWKRLALKKVGDKINIPQRQFLGFHPQLNRHIERIINHHLKDIEMQIKKMLKR